MELVRLCQRAVDVLHLCCHSLHFVLVCLRLLLLGRYLLNVVVLQLNQHWNYLVARLFPFQKLLQASIVRNVNHLQVIEGVNCSV